MDGWMDFIPPGGTEPKGPWHANYNTYDSSASPKVSHKPFELPFAQSFPIPLASCAYLFRSLIMYVIDYLLHL
jgi:hypothetical protein